MNARPSFFAVLLAFAPLAPLAACKGEVPLGSGDAPGPSGDRTPPGDGTGVGTPTPTPPGTPPGAVTPKTACAGTAGLQAGSPWPMLGGCTTHQGRSAYVPSPSLSLQWTKTTLGSSSLGAYMSPSIAADGTLYAAATGVGNPAEMFALTPGGSEKWSLSVMEQAHFGWSVAAIAKDGTAYVAPANFGEIGAPWVSALYALGTTGDKVWTFDTGGASPQPAAIRDDGVIVTGAYGHVYAVHADGSKLWDFPVPQGVYGAPAVAPDGTIYAASVATLYAIDASGTQKWAYASTHTEVDGTPVVADDGTVFVRAGYDHLLAVRADGTLAWDYTIKSDTPTNYGGGLGVMVALAADGTIYVTHNFALHALAPDGSKKWDQPSVKALSTPVVAADGTIVVTTTDGTIVRVTANGDVVSTLPAPPGVTFPGEALNGSPIIGANGHLYVAVWSLGLADYGP
jgi:hypothetical protein